MTTLFDAILKLAGFMTPMWVSDATATDTNSLTDSLASFSEDHVGGTIFMLDGALEGTAIKVTSRTTATKLAFANQPDSISSGDHYSLANSDYPVGLLRHAVNDALRALHIGTGEDDTLETVARREAYVLPDGVRQVLQVWMAKSLDAPHEFVKLSHWVEENGELRFPTAYAPQEDGWPLKLVYRTQHETITDDSDELPRELDPELVHWEAATWLCREANMRYHNDPKRDIANKMNEAVARANELKRNWNKPTRDPRPADW